MSKEEFLLNLRAGLTGLPEEDVERSLDYYSEMIEDRMEDGLPEETAVEALGNIEDIISQILMDTSLPKLVKAKVKPQRKLKAWEVVLLVLGSPLWLSLLCAAACIVGALYLVLWAGIAALYAAVAGFASGTAGGLFGIVWALGTGHFTHGLMLLGGGLVCLGLTLLSFLGTTGIAKKAVILSRQILIGIKACFIGKEEAK